MKTFAARQRRRTPAARRTPIQRLPASAVAGGIQRAEVRQILRGPRPQAKLTVGAANDAYEREADRVAEAVMRMPEPDERIQRDCPGCEEELWRQPMEEREEEEELQRQPADLDEEDETLQARAEPAEVPVIDSDLETRVRAIRGGGRPLSGSTRSFFEPRFGRDFGQVRVHTGDNAGRLAGDLQARAFTVGSDIVFGHQTYSPREASGRRLLAHELAHVAQQGDQSTGAVRRFTDNGTWTMSSASVTVEPNDILWNLAKRIVNRGPDWKLLGISKLIRPGQVVDVTMLLASLEQRLRAAISKSTGELKAEFPGAGESFFAGEGAAQSRVEEFFREPPAGTPKPVCDCLGAGYLVYSKGLLEVLRSGEFDALYTSDTIPDTFTGADLGAMKVGDWSYIQNDPRYLDPDKHPDGGYQGENIIKVGDDQYWGFPLGVQNYSEWEQKLIDVYNSGLDPADQISSIPGFDSTATQFLDVAKIAQDLFRHRTP